MRETTALDELSDDGGLVSGGETNLVTCSLVRETTAWVERKISGFSVDERKGKVTFQKPFFGECCEKEGIFGVGTEFFPRVREGQTDRHTAIVAAWDAESIVSSRQSLDRTLSHNRQASQLPGLIRSGTPNRKLFSSVFSVHRIAGMAGVSSGLQFRLMSILGLLLLLALMQQWECVGVVRAELYDRALEEDRKSCFNIVSSWTQAQLHELSSPPSESALDGLKLQDLLFFLHVPRTGGRTFHQCFLKHLFKSDERCKSSYVKLRLDPGCRLISTHDDYSIMEKLPHDKTSVVTTLREPVDRVLSTYEFSIEVAARSLRNQQKKVLPKGRMTTPSQFMSTVDIWPWRYLVPMMKQDLKARQDARLGLGKNPSSSRYDVYGTNVTQLTENDSYDASLIAMPLHEYVRHPAVHELVHNGATFQVAGLTNTSYSEHATEIRRCVIRFPSMGKDVVEVAKKRLDRMWYLGLTERQNESALFLTKFLKDQISLEVFMSSILQISSVRSKEMKIQPNFTSLAEFTQEEVMEEMIRAYTYCVNDLRRSQIHRRTASLDHIKPILFSRERRKLIPDSVMDEVAGLNQLDAELYAYAQVLFLQQQKSLQHGDLMKDPKRMLKGDRDTHKEGLNGNYKFIHDREGLEGIWGLTILWVVMIIVLLLIGIYVVTTRRFSKGVKET